MQLFTMGINKLDTDGTLALNDQDETMLAYTNEDIESFAIAWTGFNLQPRHSNIEGRDNRLDPMKIQAIWLDRFPCQWLYWRQVSEMPRLAIEGFFEAGSNL